MPRVSFIEDLLERGFMGPEENCQPIVTTGITALWPKAATNPPIGCIAPSIPLSDSFDLYACRGGDAERNSIPTGRYERLAPLTNNAALCDLCARIGLGRPLPAFRPVPRLLLRLGDQRGLMEIEDHSDGFSGRLVLGSGTGIWNC